jgi:hypothetical protein
MYKLIKIDLKKSENIHNVHQFVVYQTTQQERKAKKLKSELLTLPVRIELVQL